MLSDIHLPCSRPAKQLSHLLDRIGLSNRGGGIVSRQAAAVERSPGICEREMERMPYEIVHEHRQAAYAQCFLGKLNDLSRREVVQEERAANKIKTRFPKRQVESMGGDLREGAVSRKMGRETVEKRHIDVYIGRLELSVQHLGDITLASGHLEDRKLPQAGTIRDLFQQA